MLKFVNIFHLYYLLTKNFKQAVVWVLFHSLFYLQDSLDADFVLTSSERNKYAIPDLQISPRFQNHLVPVLQTISSKLSVYRILQHIDNSYNLIMC
jgi:hypothetical protein